MGRSTPTPSSCLLRFPFGAGVDPDLTARVDDTVRVNYHINSLVDEDFSPTIVMLDRRQRLDTVQFPFKGFDAVWEAFEAGEILELTVNYPAAGMFRGVYTWGWREHPPRIQFLQPVYEIRNQNTGEIELDPQGRSYATRNRDNLTLENIGSAAPEMKMLEVAEAALTGVKPSIIERWMTQRHLGPRGTWQEWVDLIKNQIQLPEEAWDILAQEGIGRGQTGKYDMISVFLNNEFVGGAGSQIQAAGDYLFLDRRQPFLEAGLWNILRVTDDGVSGGTDVVKVQEMKTEFGPDGEHLRVAGVNSPRPAGDTAQRVAVYAGALVDGRCTGALLGHAPVDSGSGRWELRQAVSEAPGQVCVQSQAGGAIQGSFSP